jgi:AraC-like DNA-binding protein
MARPIKKIKLDGEQIEKLASLGHSDEVIAVLAGCQESTLHRRFATHLRMGRANLHHQIRTLQIEKARAGSDTMLIWLGKVYLQQREHVEQTIRQETSIVIDLGDTPGT